MIDTSLFPYKTLPVRLYIKEENKICWFKDEIDLQKYLTRYKLDKRKLKIDINDQEPIQFSATDTNDLQQRTTKVNRRSTGTSKGRTKNVDKRGNISKTGKSKR
jgi:hypothetical protein